MTRLGLVAALVVLAAVAMTGLVSALRLWPRHDPDAFAHHQDNLPRDHPHLQGHRDHAHPFVVDDNHPRWASQL
ncbi:hypothetical protein PVW53_12860 [Seohaeicola sp. SP36]|uniref:hypothetical protein n=1 Tax=unclassified Seohaeicola TaxID=2641111 RepID=UPI00237C132C|nr:MULTISPECIES: hypothetical protein [unclassified Seohaeicola]MDD9708430.1 hypothetical protein [Seohaeicola sp. 4SK31]MDD9736416.1 hypothetical protein [Seohaeicola sp. SP36]